MKLKVLVSIILVAGLSVGVKAQETTTNFLSSVESYFTSFNTNYSFTNVTLEVATGLKEYSGAEGESSYLDVQYDIGSWNVNINSQYGALGQAFNEFEVGGGYRIVSHYDLAVDINLEAGYDGVTHGYVVEPGVMVKKKLTTNTYTEIGLSKPIETVGKGSGNVMFKVGAGFTF